MNEENDFIKGNGIFYTGKKLAEKMISLLNINYKKEFTLIEPAVGEGHILSIIVEKFLIENTNKSEHQIASFLETNIVGFDIRDDAINKCIEKLNKIAKKYINRTIKWNIKQFNALNRDELINEFGTYDFVISNPPYVSRHNMDKNTINSLKEKSNFCSKYNFDLYYYFFEIGLDLWNKNGNVVYITPNSYIRAKSGEVMLKYLINNSLIHTIIDYEDEMLFEGAHTYSAITVLSENNKNLTMKDSSGNVISKVNYKVIANENKYKIYSHNFLSEFKEGYLDLGEITDIRNGLASLNDKVFIINENEIIRETKDYLLIRKNNQEFHIETQGLKKVIRASSIHSRKYIIFPYVPVNKNKTTYVQQTELKYYFPNIYNYLNNHLSDAYREKYGIYFGRTQGFTCYEGQKIIIPKVASLENEPFKIVNKGFVLAGLSIKLKREYVATNMNLILEYLNSDEVRKYLNVISKNYAAGYKSISSTDLKKIKIPYSLIVKI